jgi:hypothetical protein
MYDHKELLFLLRSGSLLVPVPESIPGIHELADMIEFQFSKHYEHIFWNMKHRNDYSHDAVYLTCVIKRIKESSSVSGLKLLAECFDIWEKEHADQNPEECHKNNLE